MCSVFDIQVRSSSRAGEPRHRPSSGHFAKFGAQDTVAMLALIAQSEADVYV